MFAKFKSSVFAIALNNKILNDLRPHNLSLYFLSSLFCVWFSYLFVCVCVCLRVPVCVPV